MTRVFLCYRRKDSKDITDRIREELSKTLGRCAVYMDLHEGQIGVSYRKILQKEVKKSRAVLVIIGEHWQNATDDQGNRRLDNPNDDVRTEIETAFASGRLTIPVLVNQAEMPESGRLPPSLRMLVQLNAARVRSGPEFKKDVADLAAEMATRRNVMLRSFQMLRRWVGILSGRQTAPKLAARVLSLALVFGLALSLAGVLWLNQTLTSAAVRNEGHERRIRQLESQIKTVSADVAGFGRERNEFRAELGEQRKARLEAEAKYNKMKPWFDTLYRPYAGLRHREDPVPPDVVEPGRTSAIPPQGGVPFGMPIPPEVVITPPPVIDTQAPAGPSQIGGSGSPLELEPLTEPPPF